MHYALRKCILVTGGAGYIGSHACKALAQAGYTPVAYDNLVYGHRAAVRWGPLEIGDIADRSRLDAVIEQYRPEAVMHFAAYTYVGESVLDPGKYYRNNVVGTLTLLEAMRDHGIQQFVFSSTCATYGEPERIPIDETHPQRPINPYGASKLMIERMLGDFSKAHGLRWIALRYFNAAGADPDGEIGEEHNPETHLIPLVLDAAAGVRPSITIYGDDYATADGTCIRDYIHVSDLADAHVLALHALQDSLQGARPDSLQGSSQDSLQGARPDSLQDSSQDSLQGDTANGAYNLAYNLGNGQGYFRAGGHPDGHGDHRAHDSDRLWPQTGRRPTAIGSGCAAGAASSGLEATPHLLGSHHYISLALASEIGTQ